VLPSASFAPTEKPTICPRPRAHPGPDCSSSGSFVSVSRDRTTADDRLGNDVGAFHPVSGTAGRMSSRSPRFRDDGASCQNIPMESNRIVHPHTHNGSAKQLAEEQARARIPAKVDAGRYAVKLRHLPQEEAPPSAEVVELDQRALPFG